MSFTIAIMVDGEEAIDMTEQEFWDDVETWDDLIEICYEYNCYVCDEIFDEDTRDEYINEYVANTGDYWDEVRDFLNGIPTGYDRYYRNDFGEWYGTYDGDDVFNDSKDEVGEWLAESGYFETEEEEEIEDDDFGVYEDPRDAYVPEIDTEDLEIFSLMDFCSENSDVIRESAAENDELPFGFGDNEEVRDELDFEEFDVECLLNVV